MAKLAAPGDLKAAASKPLLCGRCVHVSNLTLRGSSMHHIAKMLLRGGPVAERAGGATVNAALLEAAERTAHYGPTLLELQDTMAVCALCREIFTLLTQHDLLKGDLSRRTVLRLVSASGHLSDGVSEFRERSSHGGDANQWGWGVAALSVAVEKSPHGGDFDDVAGVGLRLFSPEACNPQVEKIVLRREVRGAIIDTAIPWARKLLNGCINGTSDRRHHRCTQTLSNQTILDTTPGTAQLPNRLLLISDTTWKIVTTKGATGRYAILSYCWGGVEAPIQLTRSNAPELQNERLISDLPRTLSGSIFVAKQLGFHYIWIDQLCIMQGDEKDWVKEAAEMSNYYGQAALTIVPLAVNNTNDDCLMREQVRAVPIPWFGSGDEPGVADYTTEDYVCVTATLPVKWSADNDQDPSGLRAEMEHGRWNTRGWTFQELWLSRRVLYLGRYQWYWECLEMKASEDEFDQNVIYKNRKSELWSELRKSDNLLGWTVDLVDDQLHKTALTQSSASTDTTSRIGNAALKGVKNIASWKVSQTAGRAMQKAVAKASNNSTQLHTVNMDSLISNYTLRSLSFVEDKLVAFQGLASAIEDRSKKKFYAGIWTMNLARSLFWMANEKPLMHPGWARAPSWSWAAWDGEIRGSDHVRSHFFLNERKSFGNADLIDPDFLDDNLDMKRSAKVSPLSISVSGYIYDATRSEYQLDTHFPETLKELQKAIGLWGHPTRSRPSPNAHLLLIPPDDIAAGLDATHSCATCNAPLGQIDEESSLIHEESCTRQTSTFPAATAVTRLCGAAYFDDPVHPPRTFQCLLLFHVRDESVRYNESKLLRTLDRGEPSLTSDYRRVLLPSRPAMLGVESRAIEGSAVPKLLNDNDYANAKRTYLLLLLQETEKKGHFRRVGVAIAYWIPKMRRFGGLALHDIHTNAAKQARPKGWDTTNPQKIVLV